MDLQEIFVEKYLFFYTVFLPSIFLLVDYVQNVLHKPIFIAFHMSV
jgi:hypothetical protein